MMGEVFVFDRDEIKHKMIERLFFDNRSGKKIEVIPIVGMGDAGKTTLAQLLYHDESVKKHFERSAWVCISEEFSLLKTTKLILQAIKSDM